MQETHHRTPEELAGWFHKYKGEVFGAACAGVTGGVAAFVQASSPLAGKVVQIEADTPDGVAGGGRWQLLRVAVGVAPLSINIFV